MKYPVTGRRHLRESFLVGLICAERSTYILRILIANSPRMYRESMALSIIRERPGFEVLVAAPKLWRIRWGRFGRTSCATTGSRPGRRRAFSFGLGS